MKTRAFTKAFTHEFRREFTRELMSALVLILGITSFLGLSTVKTVRAQKHSAELSGLVTVSGTVTSAKPFKAARVYFRNTDKRMLYMVFTRDGKYKAMYLAPGNYEVSVEAKDLTSDVQKIELKKNPAAEINLQLHDVTADASNKNNVEIVAYDQLYPQGQGRKIAERLCIRCHGPNFLPSKRFSEEQWNGAIDFMMGISGEGPNSWGAQIQPNDLTPPDRQTLVQYMMQNFGPDSKLRTVKVQTEMPVDEAKISNAMFIEYYLTPDGPGVGNNDPKYASMRRGPFAQKRVSQDIVFDPKGNVWVTDRSTPNRIAKLDPRAGDFQDFVTPAPTMGIHDFMIDKDAMIWVPETHGPNVDVFDTNSMKWVGAYAMDPDHVIQTTHQESQGLVIDSKHNVYMNFIIGNGISRLDWQTKKAAVTLMPTVNNFPYGIVKDNKDNVWIAEFHGSKITKMDAETQKYTEYTPPTNPALIRRLTVDSKDDVWFGLFSAGKLDKLDTKKGTIKEWTIPFDNSQPYDEKESGGKIWVSDGGEGGALMLFDPASESFTVYPVPQRTDLPMIRVANDGAVWYAPRSAKNAGIGVLYPDMNKITTLAGYGDNR